MSKRILIGTGILLGVIAGAASVAPQSGSPRTMVASNIHWQEHNEKQIMKAALGGVYEEREAALQDLSDNRYRREDRIRILQAVLKNAKDWETRVKAAMVLITSFCSGSITETVFEKLFETYSNPL